MNARHKAIEINGDAEWFDLRGNIDAASVRIARCGDIHPYANGPIFSRAHAVQLDGCDKNFVYYWLNTYTFPVAKEIILNSHPCEMDVLCRFRDQAVMYLDPRFSRYKERLGNYVGDSVVIIDSDRILAIKTLQRAWRRRHERIATMREAWIPGGLVCKALAKRFEANAKLQT